MRLLYDQLRTEGIWTETGSRPAEKLPQQIFFIQNVADYFNELSSSWVAGSIIDIAKEFPNIAPPFPCFWSEFRKTVEKDRISFGVLTFAIDWDLASKDKGYYLGEDIKFFGDQKKRSYGAPLSTLPIRWTTFNINFMSCGYRCPVVRRVNALIDIKHDGSYYGMHFYMEDPFLAIVETLAKESGDDPEQAKISETGASVGEAFFPVLLATSLMHCKNVKTARVEMSPKIKKQVQKKHGLTPSSYKILDIEPMKRVLRTEGDIATKGIKHALHICRGHFKTYEGKGLFGKYPGTYWWADNVKGSADKGVIHKDYRVKAPKEQPQ